MPVGIWVLLGILGLAATMLTLAQSNAATRPSAGSTAPSGLRIFATLARSAGYDVDSTRDPLPRFEPRDVPVVVLVESSSVADWIAELEQSPEEKAFEEHVLKFVREGGTAVIGKLSGNFRKASIDARKLTRVLNPDQTVSAEVSALTILPAISHWIGDDALLTPVWRTESGAPVLDIASLGRGRLIVVYDFLPATNRFITEADHAPLIMGALAKLVPSDSRLRFLEAAWGNAQEPGILDRLGPGYAAGWGQVLVCLIVIVYSLGRGFGLPPQTRPRQRGQRDLVEATAGFYRRANATDVALTAALADARHKILNELKLARGTEWAVWSERVPESLRNIYREVEIASQERIRPQDAIRVAMDLDREVTQFIGKDRLASRRKVRSDGTRRSRF